MAHAIAAQCARPMVRRDDLAHGRADAGLQAAAAEQQVRDERQEPAVDCLGERCLHARRLGAPSAGVLWRGAQFGGERGESCRNVCGSSHESRFLRLRGGAPWWTRPCACSCASPAPSVATTPEAAAVPDLSNTARRSYCCSLW
jgi:hypothetical protein